MPQGSGFDNTAPMPIPGGYANATGANTGIPSAAPGSVPAAYGSPVGAIPSSPSGSAFPANGMSGSSTGTPSLAGTSSGFADVGSQGNNYSQLLKMLGSTYGGGVGAMLADILGGGLYNPQVANALLAAMQPGIERGLVSTEQAFGAEGARFSSSAQIGVGDYESQAVLGENQTLANLYLNDQQMQLSLLENILPTVHAEQVNREKSGVLDDILGAGEIAAGVGLTLVTGGVGQLGGAYLIGQGANTIVQGNSSGSSGGGSGGIPNISLPTNMTGTAGLGNSQQGNIPPVGDDSTLINDLQNQWLSSSAGSTVGGASTSGGEESLMGLLGIAE